MDEAVQRKFQKLIRNLSRIIQAEAEANLPTKKSNAKAKPRAGEAKWASAYVDARWFSDAEGFTAKLRVVLLDGKLHGIQISTEVAALLDKVWHVRSADPSAVWYGLKVTVDPDGAITTDLNTDPNCVVDPSWYYS